MGTAVDVVARQPLLEAPDLVAYWDAVELDLFALEPFAASPDLVAYGGSPFGPYVPAVEEEEEPPPEEGNSGRWRIFHPRILASVFAQPMRVL